MFAKEKAIKIRIVEFAELDSTNEEAKRMVRAAVNPAELFGAVITARSQSSGKGRRGRSFYSPETGSVYASFILPPPENFSEQVITPLAAVAVCEALEKTTSCKPRVKWVNDVLIEGKKVCGILAESIPGAVVLGIGININLHDKDVPEDLKETVFSLKLNDSERTRFFDALVEAVFRNVLVAGDRADRLMDDYRSRFAEIP